MYWLMKFLTICIGLILLDLNFTSGQLNLQSLMPLLGLLGKGGGGGGGLGGLLGGLGGGGGGGGGGLDLGSLLGSLGGGGGGGGGSALAGLLAGGGGGGGSPLSGLLSGAGGGGGSALSGLLSGGGGGAGGLGGLLSGGGGGGGAGLAGLLSGGGGGGGGSQLGGLAAALASGQGGGSGLLGGLGGGGGGGGGGLSGMDPAMLSSLLNSARAGGLGGMSGSSQGLGSLGGNMGGLQGGLQGMGGSGFGGSQGLGGSFASMSGAPGFSGPAGFGGGNNMMQSSSNSRDAQLMQMLQGGSQSQSFGSPMGQSSSDLIASMLAGRNNGGDDSMGGMIASDSQKFAAIQRDQGSPEFWSKESKPCFVDGYKGSCMPISLQGVCKLYNYEIRDGGCINFQTMSRDVCCFKRDNDLLISALRSRNQPPGPSGPPGPPGQMMASSSNFQASNQFPAGPPGQSPMPQNLLNSPNPNVNSLPPGFLNAGSSQNSAQGLGGGFSSLSGSSGGGQGGRLNLGGPSQPAVNPITNTIGAVMGSQLQSTAAGAAMPPSVANLIMNAIQSKGQNTGDMVSNLIDGFLTMNVPLTTPKPVAVADFGGGVLPESISSQISPEMLPAVKAAAANMTPCTLDGNRGLCMPPMMQTMCQNMKLKISSQGCAGGQICCAKTPESRIPDDMANSVKGIFKKGKSQSDDDDMLAQGSSVLESRLFMPEGRARKACTVSGFDGICVATSLTALCPGLGMQISPTGCETTESCCYSADTSASNIDPSLLREEPLAISFDKPTAEMRAPPLGPSLASGLGNLQADASVLSQNPAAGALGGSSLGQATGLLSAPLAAPAVAGGLPGMPGISFSDIGSIVKAVVPLFLNRNKQGQGENGADGQGQGRGQGQGQFQGGQGGQQQGGVCGGRGEAASCIGQEMATSCLKMGYKTRMGGCQMDQLCCYTPTNELDKDASYNLESAAKCVIQEHPGICVPSTAARNCSMYNLEVSLYGCSSPDLSCCYTRNSVNGQCGIKGKGSAAPTYGGYANAGAGIQVPELGFPDPDFADVGEYCWQAALLDRSTGNYFCSAVLIDTIWLLTSAHCIAKRSPMDITVRLGEWDFNVTTEVPGPRDYSVFNLYIHSTYNSKTLENDIAMLKLNRPADISLSNICLACRPGQIDYYGMNCQAGGWGKLGQNFPYSSRLKRIPTRIWPNQECAYRLKNSPLGSGFKFQTTSFMCGSATGRQTICNGDGGGPLVCSVGGNYQLAGIVVSGIQCGQGGMPALFVNLGQYQAWIDEVMKN